MKKNYYVSILLILYACGCVVFQVYCLSDVNKINQIISLCIGIASGLISIVFNLKLVNKYAKCNEDDIHKFYSVQEKLVRLSLCSLGITVLISSFFFIAPSTIIKIFIA